MERGLMDVQGIGQTDVGLVRKNNEDAFLVDLELGLFVVCDGMGGHVGGEVAAETAVSMIRRVVSEHQELLVGVTRDVERTPELAHLLEDALRQACREIYNKAVSERGLAGMGCTATAIVIVGDRAVMGHVGDTRLYMVRGGGAHQLSSDHTLAAELARQGALRPEEVRGHSQSHVLTRALGPQALVDVETLAFDLVADDRLLLCSDGLADYVPSEEWLGEVATTRSLEELPDELIDFAKNSGGRDNITVLAVAIGGPPPTAELPVRSPQLALDVLRSSFLFADLTLAQLARLLERCEARVHEAGEVICNVGDHYDELMLVVDGTLRITGADGRTAELGPGGHLGENLVLRPRQARAAVVAEERASVLVLDNASALDVAARRPWLGVAVLTRLAQRLSSDLDRLSSPELLLKESPADLL